MVITKNWETGGGAVTITYDGDGDGTISVSSDINPGAPRQMVLAVSNDYGQSVDLTVKQDAIVLPDGYKRLQYISCNRRRANGAIIKSGLYAGNTTGIKTTVRHRYTDSTGYQLVGVQTGTSSSNYRRHFFGRSSAGDFYVGWRNTYVPDAADRPSFPANTWAECEVNYLNSRKWRFTPEGGDLAEGNLEGTLSNITADIFNISGYRHYSNNMDQKETIVTTGSVITQYWIPAISLSDNLVGMYDIINDVFKGSGNAPTYVFTAGPDWE